jgi:hypothetical protein
MGAKSPIPVSFLSLFDPQEQNKVNGKVKSDGHECPSYEQKLRTQHFGR